MNEIKNLRIHIKISLLFLFGYYLSIIGPIYVDPQLESHVAYPAIDSPKLSEKDFFKAIAQNEYDSKDKSIDTILIIGSNENDSIKGKKVIIKSTYNDAMYRFERKVYKVKKFKNFPKEDSLFKEEQIAKVNSVIKSSNQHRKHTGIWKIGIFCFVLPILMLIFNALIIFLCSRMKYSLWFHLVPYIILSVSLSFIVGPEKPHLGVLQIFLIFLGIISLDIFFYYLGQKSLEINSTDLESKCLQYINESITFWKQIAIGILAIGIGIMIPAIQLIIKLVENTVKSQIDIFRLQGLGAFAYLIVFIVFISCPVITAFLNSHKLLMIKKSILQKNVENNDQSVEE